MIATAGRGFAPDFEDEVVDDHRELYALYGARCLAEVSTEAPAPRVWGRYVADGHTIFYGKGGVGKGMVLANDIGRLIATGERVFIIDYENHPDEWARRIAALHGKSALDSVLIVTPLDPAQWHEKTGAIWEVQVPLRHLADAFGATWVFVDSIVPGCFGQDPNAPGTPQQYGAAIAAIGRPAVSIGQVNRAGDLRYPFGSALWRYQARGTVSIEPAPGSPGGHQVLLTDTKANNHARAERTLVSITYLDDLPREVSERPYTLALADQIVTVLGSEAMTVTGITTELNAEVEEDDRKVRANSVLVALRRGLTEPGKRFTVTGKGKTAEWREI